MTPAVFRVRAHAIVFVIISWIVLSCGHSAVDGALMDMACGSNGSGIDTRETVINTDISGNVVWNGSMSPCNITGNVTVGAGSSLTISEGVEVNVFPGVVLNVEGELNVEGLPGDPCLIDLGRDDNDSGRFVMGPNAVVRISHATVANGNFGVENDRGDLTVDHVTFRDLVTGVVSNGVNSSDTHCLLSECVFDDVSGREVIAGPGTVIGVNTTMISATASGDASQVRLDSWIRLRFIDEDTGEGVSNVSVKVGNTYSDPFSESNGGDMIVYRTPDRSGSDPYTDHNGHTLPFRVTYMSFHNGSEPNFHSTYMDASVGSWSVRERTIDAMTQGDREIVTDLSPPPKPVNISAQLGTGLEVMVSWTFLDPFEVDGVYLYMSAYEEELKKTESYLDAEGLGLVDTPQFNYVTIPSPFLNEETRYFFAVRCRDDQFRNSDWSDTVSVVTPDVTAPAIPTDFHARNITGNSTEIHWDGSVSDDVAGYEVQMNQTPEGSFETVGSTGSDGRSLKVAGLVAETSYLFRIRVFDPQGNYNTTEPFMVNTPDVTPPAAPELNAPGLKSGNVTSKESIYLVMAVDEYVIARVFVNDREAAVIEGDGVITFNVTLDEGENKIGVELTDGANNTGPRSAPLIVFRDNTEPELELDIPVGYYIGNLLNMTVTATDGSGISSYHWKIVYKSGENTVDVHDKWGDDPWLEYSFAIPGTYTVILTVEDLVGNIAVAQQDIQVIRPDKEAPGIKSVPFSGQIDVPVDVNITINFTEEVLNDETLRVSMYVFSGSLDVLENITGYFDGSVDVDDLGNITRINGTRWDYDGEGIRITFSGDSSLDHGTVYVVEVHASDPSGNLVHRLIHFTTKDRPVDVLDTDEDGIPDQWENKFGLNPSSALDALEDWDSDNLTNIQEYLNGTDPNDADSDGDGFTDGEEVMGGTDPRDDSDSPGSVPAGKNDSNVMLVLIFFVILLIFIIVMYIRLRLTPPGSDKDDEKDREPSFFDDEDEKDGDEGERPPSEMHLNYEAYDRKKRRSERGPRCPECGARLGRDVSYCYECGSTVKRKPDETIDEMIYAVDEKKRSRQEKERLYGSGRKRRGRREKRGKRSRG